MRGLILLIIILFTHCASPDNVSSDIEPKQMLEQATDSAKKDGPITCDIKYDTITSFKYDCHKGIIETLEGKIKHKLVVQDIMCFISSIDVHEKEPYRTLTNMVLNKLLEKDPQKLFYVLIANLNTEEKNYVKLHLQRPICRTLDTSYIFRNIRVVLDKYDGKAEFAKEMNTKMNDLIAIIKNAP